MTLQTPPSWLQAGSYPAQYDRLNQQALYATTGIIGSSSMAVTANSPAGMSVLVASGWAAVIGTTTSNMGVYTAYNDASVTLTITTADPTNPRIDRVCMTIRDAYYTGSSNDVIYQVIAGTPAGSPVAPALPANSISLATVAVGAAVTQINSGNITDARVSTTTNLPVGDITEVQGSTGITVTSGTGPIPSVAIDSTVVTLTGSQTLTTKTLTSPTINGAFTNSVNEIIARGFEEDVNVVASAATGTINFDVSTASIWYYTSNATANHTLNFRYSSGASLSSKLAVGDAITLVWLNTNGATPYYPNVIQIDGTTVTPKVPATISAGNASAIDSYTFTIIKTAATPTYTVLETQTKFA